MRNVRIGAPGFILMRETARDMPGTLKRIADLGYDGFEFLGFFGHSAEEISRWCQEAGLRPYGCFARLDELAGIRDGGTANEFDRAVEMQGDTPDEKAAYLKEIGCEYVSLMVPNSTMDETRTERINQVSKLVRKYGMKLQYHNHDYEYTNMVNGKYRMDSIMENTIPDVLFEPDLGWMEIGGYRCKRALEKYADRIEVIHLKDYYRDAFDISLPYEFRPIGYGVMDWASILPLCEKKIKPVWYTADHDKAMHGDISEELKLSLDFIRNAVKFC